MDHPAVAPREGRLRSLISVEERASLRPLPVSSERFAARGPGATPVSAPVPPGRGASGVPGGARSPPLV
eukprot:8606101-Pyramimonas_sp.AAC.1